MKSMKKLIAAFMCTAVAFTSFGIQPVRADEEAEEVEPVEEQFKIDEAHFPDENFRKCVAINSDTDGDGWLDNYEIKYTWNLYCENSGVNTVKGIEYFPDLQGLWCKGNNITELDLSKNPKLFGVWCSFNPIKKLDFSPCPDLAWVYCFNCQLEELNFKDNPKLAYLECNKNENLKELDVTHNLELENLFCSNCSLETLDVTHNELLCELDAFGNKLKTLDVSHNPLLKRLDIWDNEELGDVDVSNLKEMQYYNIGNTAAKNPDISNNKHLMEFVCNYNEEITSLDLSHNPELAYLAVECDVSLKELDLSHNPKLYYLLAFGLSSIDNIDISKNYRLCKAFNEGEYMHEDREKIGLAYEMKLDYGGSSDPFDELRHLIALDDRIDASLVNSKFNGVNVPDCRLDTNDGLPNNERFITRGCAIQTLYMLAGEILGKKPDVSNLKTRFTDVPKDASYYDAVKWGEANNICFGYPVLCDNKFSGEELINRQDFALMAHRFADLFKLGTALDYGRSDWFKDSLEMDFYTWAPLTWAIQWKIVDIKKDAEYCYPHGRITYNQLYNGLVNLMDIDVGATYAQRVGGNFGAEGDPDATEEQGTGYVGVVPKDQVKIVIAETFAGTTGGTKTSENKNVVANEKAIEKDAYENEMVTLAEKDKEITSITDEKDASGSTFSLLKAKQAKVKKNSIKISWKKVNGADSYVVYGNKCGKNNKYVKLKEVKGTSFTQKKLKKGTYYKYIVVAVGKGKVLATSKTLHIATKGGKVGNDKSVKVKKLKYKLKKGKTAKIKAYAKAESKKLKVKKHRKLSYETSNPAVAKVLKNGKIKAVGKGSCNIYVYAQNGVYKQVKVTVK